MMCYINVYVLFYYIYCYCILKREIANSIILADKYTHNFIYRSKFTDRSTRNVSLPPAAQLPRHPPRHPCAASKGREPQLLRAGVVRGLRQVGPERDRPARLLRGPARPQEISGARGAPHQVPRQ